MSVQGTKAQAWSLFPAPLDLTPNTPIDAINFHNLRRLSPIPNSDEQESLYSSASPNSRDMAFYAPSPTSSSRNDFPEKQRLGGEKDLGITFVQQLAPLQPHPTSLEFKSRTEPPSPVDSTSSERPQSRERPRSRKDLYSEFLDQSAAQQRQVETQRIPFRVITSSTITGAPSTVGSRTVSRQSNASSYQTGTTSLPPLQQKGLDEFDQLEPLTEEDIDPGCFDLVAPVEEAGTRQYSLERRSEQLFSTEHLQLIFADPSLLLRFTSFLSTFRPSSIAILIYYLDAIKALKAIHYSNAIAEALDPIPGLDFTASLASKTLNTHLEDKAKEAFGVMVRDDLPAYITHTYIQTVSLSIQRRITGTMAGNLRDASEGLAEVFCLSDPSRPDNPIVFASEEFHRTTQYGMSYAIGRNCRFLQGPKTNPFSSKRIREKVEAGVEHCETFLNYRRDGSPFMNLLMVAPLCDSRGTVRYFIGAQVDVSGLVKECSEMESLRRLSAREDEPTDELQEIGPLKDEFQELSEMLNLNELDTVRKWGGRMHKQVDEEHTDNNFTNGNWKKPRQFIGSTSPDVSKDYASIHRPGNGRLSGIYENYLLIRPYPSLRVLFASPALRVPGISQSPFMDKIGGSPRVREELTQALADGRGVTAKVKWLTKADAEGRNRWIHCTPLQGSNGAIGCWMVVVVDDEQSTGKKFKTAPPVDPKFGRSMAAPHRDVATNKDFAIMHGAYTRDSSLRGRNGGSGSLRSQDHQGSDRSASPYSLRI